MEGTIRLATATVNRAPSPAKRLRKARPAKKAIPTVSPITTRPSRRERHRAPQMSTMPTPAQSFPNQWVETPFIGKVTPLRTLEAEDEDRQRRPVEEGDEEGEERGEAVEGQERGRSRMALTAPCAGR